MEVWKDIKGYEEYYQISNLGRVKSKDRIVKHWRGGDRTYRGKIVKKHISKDYEIVGLSRSKTDSKRVKIHRLVALHFVEGYFEDAVVNHKDGNKRNNNPDNLEWVTDLQNRMHAKENGLMVSGEDHFASKYVLNTITGIFYGSIKEASESTELSYSYFRNMINGTQENITNYILV